MLYKRPFFIIRFLFMKHIIDIDTWERRDNYGFFRTFLNSWYSVTTEIDCTEASAAAKQSGAGFAGRCAPNHAPVPGGAVSGLPHRAGRYGAGQRAAAAESVDVSGCAQHSGSFSTQVKRAIPSPALLPAATGSHPSGHLLWKTPVGCVILRSSGHTMGQRPNGPCGKGAYL